MKDKLFLLSGFLCNQSVWKQQVKALAPYADISIPSLKGFNTLQAMAQSILDQAPESFSVAGHSMGGRVAFELMKIAPRRIKKFAIMDSAVHPLKPGEIEQRQKLLVLAREQGMTALANEWAPHMVDRRLWQDQALMQTIRNMVLSYTFTEFEFQLNALLSREDQSKYLSKIKQHVLLICGSEDTWSPVLQHQEMFNELQDGELRVINNSGHMVMLEQSELLNKVLLEWLTPHTLN